jgi:hypothetical protein
MRPHRSTLPLAKQVPVFVIGDNGAVSNAVTVWVEE